MFQDQFSLYAALQEGHSDELQDMTLTTPCKCGVLTVFYITVDIFKCRRNAFYSILKVYHPTKKLHYSSQCTWLLYHDTQSETRYHVTLNSIMLVKPNDFVILSNKRNSKKLPSIHSAGPSLCLMTSSGQDPAALHCTMRRYRASFSAITLFMRIRPRSTLLEAPATSWLCRCQRKNSGRSD